MKIHVKEIVRCQNMQQSTINFSYIPFYFNSIGQLRPVDSYCSVDSTGINISIKNDDTIFINEKDSNLYTVVLLITDIRPNLTSSSCSQFTSMIPKNTPGLYKQLSSYYTTKNSTTEISNSTVKNEVLSIHDVNGQSKIQCSLGVWDYNVWSKLSVGGYIYIEKQ